MLNDLPCLGWPSVVTSEKGEATAKNVTECPTTPSQWLAQQVEFSHTLACCTLCSIAYPYKILIQHKLKLADSPKRANFCSWLHHCTQRDVLVFDTFFRWRLVPFGWLHKRTKLLCLEFGESSHFSNNVVAFPKNWRLERHVSQMYGGTNFFFLKQQSLQRYTVIVRSYLGNNTLEGICPRYETGSTQEYHRWLPRGNGTLEYVCPRKF